MDEAPKATAPVRCSEKPDRLPQAMAIHVPHMTEICQQATPGSFVCGTSGPVGQVSQENGGDKVGFHCNLRVE